MAEEEGSSELDGMLTRKVGPLPIWSWVMIAGGAGFLLFKLGFGGKSSSAAGSGSPGQGSQFQSSQTQTGTDAAGNQFTNSYSATGNGYLPGMLTTQASPMPYSLGDIYVNVAGQSTNDGGQNPQPAQQPQMNGWIPGSMVVQLPSPMSIKDIVNKWRPLANSDPSTFDLEAEQIIQDNPQTDWSQGVLSQGSWIAIPPGIAVNGQQTIASATPGQLTSSDGGVPVYQGYDQYSGSANNQYYQQLLAAQGGQLNGTGASQ